MDPVRPHPRSHRKPDKPVDRFRRAERFPLPEGFKLSPGGRFNDKPLEHWQEKADELLLEILLRGSEVDSSIVGRMVHERLMKIAVGENLAMLQRALSYRSHFTTNVILFVAGLAADEDTKQRTPKQPVKKPAKRAKKITVPKGAEGLCDICDQGISEIPWSAHGNDCPNKPRRRR